jgi:hypothetical protein
MMKEAEIVKAETLWRNTVKRSAAMFRVSK